MFGNGDVATLADVKGWTFPNVELMVLSACETAIGDVLRAEEFIESGEDSDSITGEEILGFGYLMELAGAEAAMGSLWKVDDGGTQILMGAFYDALSRGGLSKAAALQQAQRDLIRLADPSNRGSLVLDIASSDLDPDDLSHPHYWAPFILIGNGL
jgi:CHAT domain-containing protein